MPTLAYEPDLYPDDLFVRNESDAEDECSWFALYCRSRQEKKLMRQLRSQSVAFYGPHISRKSRLPSGRLRTAHLPLFANYVFLYGTPDHRYTAQATGCVSRWLPVPDPAALVRELGEIRRLIEMGAPVTLEDRLQPGTPVRVTSGPFRGFEGTVIRRKNKTRLIVAVRFLQQGASVELDDCALEQIY